jgi:hypothetical protein
MLRLLPVRAAFLASLLVCSVTPSLAELEDHKHAGGRQSRTGRRNYGHNTSNDMKRFLIEPHYPQRGCCRSRFLVSLDAPTARA